MDLQSSNGPGPALSLLKRAGFLALAASLGSGCAINPYVTPPRPASFAKGDLVAAGGAPAAAAAPGSMASAIQYADALYDAYEGKLAEDFERQRALSGGLLTLGALGVALAAGKAHPDAILGTALTGALAYQLGTWNTSHGRLGIYVEGMKAVACAKSAIAPLRIDETELERVRHLASSASTTVADAAEAAGELTYWLSRVASARDEKTPALKLEKAVKAEEAALTATLNQANDAISRASGLERRVRYAAQSLDATLDKVRLTINRALNGTLADLAQLPKLIGSLNSYANVFAPGIQLDPAIQRAVTGLNSRLKPGDTTAQGSQPKPSTATGDTSAELAATLGRVQARHRVLARAVSELKGAVEATTIDQLNSSLAGCMVDESKITTALALDRPSVALVSGEARTSYVTISGGTRPYAATLTDLPAKGINVAAFGEVLTVSATADTTPGQTYRVRVTDAAGASVTLPIAVEAGNAATRPAGDAPAPAAAPRAEESGCIGSYKPSAEEICLVQARIGVKVDGDFSGGSCSAYRRNATARAFGAQITADAVREFRRAADLPDDAGAATLGAWLVTQGVKQCRGAQLPAREAAERELAQSASCAPKPATCRVAGANCGLECEMSNGQIARLRMKLNVDATTPGFDGALRSALRAFQAERKLLDRSGNYTPETAKALLNSATPAASAAPAAAR